VPTPNDFSDFQFGKQDSTYSNHGESRVGDYGQVNPTLTAPAPNPTVTDTPAYPDIRGYGYDPSNPQFSQDKENDPRALLEQTRSGVEAHASLNAAYGLNQPTATLGSHPWLRDGLTVTNEDEAGNAVPTTNMKVPFKGRG
jgi:hypothetical protein